MASSTGIPRGVWMLGFVSLFTDLSSSIIYGLLPGYLVAHFGATVAMVALIDAVAEGTASFAKLFSGVFSDWIRRRKELALYRRVLEEEGRGRTR